MVAFFISIDKLIQILMYYLYFWYYRISKGKIKMKKENIDCKNNVIVTQDKDSVLIQDNDRIPILINSPVQFLSPEELNTMEEIEI